MNEYKTITVEGVDELDRISGELAKEGWFDSMQTPFVSRHNSTFYYTLRFWRPIN